IQRALRVRRRPERLVGARRVVRRHREKEERRRLRISAPRRDMLGIRRHDRGTWRRGLNDGRRVLFAHGPTRIDRRRRTATRRERQQVPRKNTPSVHTSYLRDDRPHLVTGTRNTKRATLRSTALH